MSGSIYAGTVKVDVWANAWVSERTGDSVIVGVTSHASITNGWIQSHGVYCDVSCGGKTYNGTIIAGGSDDESARWNGEERTTTVYFGFKPGCGSGTISPVTVGFGQYIYGYKGIQWTEDCGPQDYATTYTTPPAPTIGANVRNSDTSNTIGWTSNATALGSYSTILVERSTDGGTWTQVASVAGSSTGYTDTSTTADHSYSYRVRATNPAGYGDRSGASATTYNTPAAPTGAAATVVSGSSISVTWTNRAHTATASSVERSTDSGATWTVVGTVDSPSATGYVDSYGGTAVYRVRNVRGDLVSAYATTNTVTSLAAPAAPTLLAPAASSIVPTSSQSVELGWRHNSVDSSAQTAAVVGICTDGSTWTETTLTQPSATWTLDLSGCASGTVVMWRVRTKGAYDGYGPDSSTSSFTVLAPPGLVISSPASDGAVVETAPVSVVLTYTDVAGSLASATVRIADSSGRTVASRTPAATVVTFSLSEFSPVDGETYTAYATARSTSTLTASAVRTFTIAYASPSAPTASIMVDEASGSVSISVVSGDTQYSTALTSYMQLLRIVDGVSTVVATGLLSGGSAIDRLPPLNTAMTYRVVAWTDYGASATTDYPLTVTTSRAIFNYGDGYSLTSSFLYNPSWSGTFEDDDELFEPAGHSAPILGSGTMLYDSFEASGTLRGLDEIRAFSAILPYRRLPMWYRSPYGDVAFVHAAFTTSGGSGPFALEYRVSMKRVADGLA